MPRFRPLTILALLLASLLLAAAAPAAAKPKMDRKARKEAVQQLPEKYRQWLTVVDLLITDEELEAFVALDKDYQRDAFIKRFWEARDTYRSTARNEFRDRWEANVQQALALFNTLEDERARILVLNGPPALRVESRCSSIIWPVEVWAYPHSDRLRSQFIVVFFRKWGAGAFRVWTSTDGLAALFADGAGASGAAPDLSAIANGCKNGDQIAGAISWVLRQGLNYDLLQQRMMEKPESQAGEWVSTFSSYSTDAEGAAPLQARMSIDYPGRYQNRTVVQGLVSVPSTAAGRAALGGANTYNLLLNGEVLQNGELFDNFRYKFDFPGTAAAAPGDDLPVVFQRYLRPGEYKMIVKVLDLNSGKVFRDERAISVPASDRVAPAPPSVDADEASARLLTEANAAISNGETSLKLVRPFGELQTGMQRFDTLTTGGDIGKVIFA